MRDQDKNQKAPETKLTDAQLDEVNAGTAMGTQGNLDAKRKSGTAIDLAADKKLTINISTGQADRQFQAIV